MNELIEKISASFEALKADAELQAEKGNKAAGTRARKASLELEKLLKEFRKASLEAKKKKKKTLLSIFEGIFCYRNFLFAIIKYRLQS